MWWASAFIGVPLHCFFTNWSWKDRLELISIISCPRGITGSSHLCLGAKRGNKSGEVWQSDSLFSLSLSLTDYRCGRELDGSWWVYPGGKADGDVVAAPSCRRRRWSSFQDVHGAAGQTKSHDAGEQNGIIWSLSTWMKWWKYLACCSTGLYGYFFVWLCRVGFLLMSTQACGANSGLQ